MLAKLKNGKRREEERDEKEGLLGKMALSVNQRLHKSQSHHLRTERLRE